MGIVVAYWVISWEQMILWMLSISMTYLQSLKRTRHMMGSLVFEILNILSNVETNQENELLDAYLYI